MKQSETIRLSHGSGGRLMHGLIREFTAVLNDPLLETENDAAILPVNQYNVVFTTDSYVVDPLFFPGGDIGRLAICGTVNDLATRGAIPKYLSVGLIIEEGFGKADLLRIAKSMREAAKEAGVAIVTGDTKVVQKGKGDGIFINTTGIGELSCKIHLASDQARSGDSVILTGPVGSHGLAILNAREDFGFQGNLKSDTAPLNHLIQEAISASKNVRVIRDVTRGGLASVLNEIAQASRCGIEIEEEAVPVLPPVRSACQMLGLDPLYLANEGVMALIADAKDEALIRDTLILNPHGKKAALIGHMTEMPKPRVVCRTSIGSHRILDMRSGDPLPRIC